MNTRKTAVGAIAALLFFIGCDDTNPFAAQLPTTLDEYTVFSLTGTPPAYPSGLNFFSRTPTRVDGNASFDVAFDINSDGKVIVYPVKLVVTSIGGDRPVGLLKVAGKFADITEAPKQTYQQDSAVVLGVGETVVIESNRAGSGDVCGFSLSPNIYSKMVVDSLNIPLHTIYVSAVLDPNCGFRSFAEGIPTK